MRAGSKLFRMGIWLASTSLSLSAAAPALAQPAGPPGAEAGQANGGDPPALAGRLAEISGTVSTHGAGDTQWNPAQVNFPVTTGDGFWTEPQATAAVEIGSDRVVMDGSTQLEVTQLDQSQFIASEPQGAVFLALTDLPNGQSVTVNTPRAAVQITSIGRYEIIAGDTNNPSTISVLEGAAHVSGSGVALDVQSGQTADITGTGQDAGGQYQGVVGALRHDSFLDSQVQQAAPQQVAASVPRQVRYMTGGTDLQRYGSWSQTSQYGQVWYPSSVPANWAPYRTGHWAYVAPWGWNWVDAQPWGFAPFHYGRWVDYGGRWGWVAVTQDAPVDDYPVYAPALVNFVDVGGAVLAGAALGFAAGEFAGGGGVGWVPLGYREPYYPWYRTSDNYFRNVNRVNVVNVNNISINNTRNITINNFANRRGATVIPAAQMIRGGGVAQYGRPLPEATLARAQPVFGRLPVRPTAATPGLTRAAARNFNIAMPARPAGRVAPGPQIRQVAQVNTKPMLRPNAMPTNVRPVGLPGGRPNAAGLGRPANGLANPAPGAINPGTINPGAVPGTTRPGFNRPGVAGPLPNGAGLNRPGLNRPGSNQPGLNTPGATNPSVTNPGVVTPGLGRPGLGAPANGRPAAPGPQIQHGGGLPPLRAPGEVGTRPGLPNGGARPGVVPSRPAPATPISPARPAPIGGSGNPRPGLPAPRPVTPGAGAQRPSPSLPRQEAAPVRAPINQAPVRQPGNALSRPTPPRPSPVVHAPVTPRVPAPTAPIQRAPRVERPAPVQPTPRAERPAPLALRPAPRIERPAPVREAPRPMPPPMREAPRPMPAPRAEPAFRPAPPPAPRPAPPPSAQHPQGPADPRHPH